MQTTLKKSIILYCLMLGMELLIFIFVAMHASWSLSPYLTGFDTMEYKAIAQNLVLNNAFSKSLEIPLIPNFFRSPGYPFWLAFIYLVFGSFKPAIILGMIIFAFSAPLMYLIIREVFSEKIAFLTGIIFALEPRMAFSAPFLLSEQIFIPIFFLAIFFAIKFLNNSQKKNYILISAVLLGISTLIRGISLYLWPILVIFFFIKLYKTRPILEILKILGLATIILILAMSPWLIRNRLTLGTWQSSSLFGIHLYWGHLETLQRYLGVPQEIAHQKNLDRAIELTGGNFETPEAVNILAKSALEEIKNNFGAYIKIYVFNAGLFLITDGYKGIASYIVNLNPNYINLGDYIIKLQIGEALNHLKSFSLMELFIPIAGRILWSIIIILSFMGAFISIKKALAQRLVIALLIFLPVYFALLTGPIFSPDPRFRMPVNGFLFAFALVGIFYSLKKKFQYELSS